MPKKETKKKVVHRNADKQMPYRDTSILGRAWQKCIVGSSVKELTKLAEKEGSKIAWLLRAMRSGERYGWTWKVREDDGKLKIYNAKKPA